VSTAASEAASAPEPDLGRYPWLPWTFRFVLALPGPSIAIAAGAMLLAATIDVGWFSASGMWHGIYVAGVPFWLDPVAYNNLLYDLSLGFSVLALIHLVRGAERDLFDLEAALPFDSESLRREVLGVPHRTLWIGTATGLAIALIDIVYLYTEFELAVFPPLAQVWVLFREFLYDVLLCRVLIWGAAAAHRLSRLVGTSVRIDLLDLAPLRSFSHNGVRLAFFWLLLWSVWTPFLLIEPALDSELFVAIAFMISIQIAFSAVALVIPTRGARKRLRDAKAAELRTVRDAIARDRAAVLDPRDPGSAAAATRLPGLLAWESRVAAVPESLLDAGSLRRLGFYLLLPLGSWVASALIQHVVDAALG
jgi:hypothetical protein